MRKTILHVVLTAVVALALLLSCDVGTNPDSEELGDGQGIFFVIGTEQYVFTDNLAAGYTPEDDVTCVVASNEVGALAENAIHIYFPGNTTGTFTDPPDATTEVPRIGILLDASYYYTWEEGKGCWFSIEVNSYGTVGGRIEGTFSGDLIDGDEIKEIRDGVFSVMRYE